MLRNLRSLPILALMVASVLYPVVIAAAHCQQAVPPVGTVPPQQQETRLPQLQLSDMRTADPDRDLRRAIARGDLRFIDVPFYGLMIPHSDKSSDSRIVILKGVNEIRGASDGPTPPGTEGLMRKAIHYAGRYNQLLIVHLLQSHDPDVLRVRQEIDAQQKRLGHSSPTADAAKALHSGDQSLLTVELGDKNGKDDNDTPGLTDAQIEDSPTGLTPLLFDPDLATQEQRQRMRKLLVSYVIPYNRIIYKAFSAKRRWRTSQRGHAETCSTEPKPQW